MFENLSDKLERSFKLLKGQGKITELNVAETLKEVRRSLLDADVNYKIAKENVLSINELSTTTVNSLVEEMTSVRLIPSQDNSFMML